MPGDSPKEGTRRKCFPNLFDHRTFFQGFLWGLFLERSLRNIAQVAETGQEKKHRLGIFKNNSSLYISNKNTNSKIYMHPNVHSNTIYNCQDMEAT